MSEFHMTLSPGVLARADQRILITFDDPEEAERVEVTLWEADRWVAGGESVREGGPNDLIAKFRGEIADGRFQGEIVRRGRARRGSPTIRVQFDGQEEVHELAVPANGNEQEAGVLEIIGAVRGQIEGSRKRYLTPEPVFVRRFRNRRPVLSFITGRGGYFAAARRYWRGHADGVFGRPSVEEVLEFVRSAPQSRGYGRWGEVNIVSHGNEWEWILWLFRRVRRGGPNLDHLKVSDLREHQGDPRLLPRPAREQLDATSQVVLRGCVLGNNQPLLDQIRVLFGGGTAVYAPKYIQYYEADREGARERFHEQFYFYRTGRRAPRVAACIDALSAKYPGRMDGAGWRRLLRRKIVRVERFTWTIEYEGHRPSRAEVMERVRTQFGGQPPDRRMGTVFDDWGWGARIGRIRRSRNFRAICTGNRVRIEVRRVLRDAEGNPVSPNLNDRSHFGVSPAPS